MDALARGLCLVAVGFDFLSMSEKKMKLNYFQGSHKNSSYITNKVFSGLDHSLNLRTRHSFTNFIIYHLLILALYSDSSRLHGVAAKIKLEYKLCMSLTLEYHK